jgi:hypothetical protein
MSPTNRPTHANTRTAVAAAQLMVMPHELHVVLNPDIPWTLFGPLENVKNLALTGMNVTRRTPTGRRNLPFPHNSHLNMTGPISASNH